MADQGATIITMAIPASTARGSMLSGAGTLSATLRAVGCVVEGTDSTETKGAVQLNGTCLAIYAATITAGDSLQADASGELIADVVATGLQCAIALESGVANDLRRVKLI